MFTGMIKKKIKRALKELFEEYVQGGKIVVKPDLKNKGVMITWTNKQ